MRYGWPDNGTTAQFKSKLSIPSSFYPPYNVQTTKESSGSTVGSYPHRQNISSSYSSHSIILFHRLVGDTQQIPVKAFDTFRCKHQKWILILPHWRHNLGGSNPFTHFFCRDWEFLSNWIPFAPTPVSCSGVTHPPGVSFTKILLRSQTLQKPNSHPSQLSLIFSFFQPSQCSSWSHPW